MNDRRLISSGSAFEAVAGYSRAVIDGDTVYVAGTTGFDYSTMTIDADPVAQTHQSQAGCTLDDVVRVHYFLMDGGLFERVAPVFGQYFATARPAATAIVCGLVDPRMQIEIEVTARRRGRP
jgi:enamine deaminase RidA (YjgF/YER057c/UK114 family)